VSANYPSAAVEALRALGHELYDPRPTAPNMCIRGIAEGVGSLDGVYSASAWPNGYGERCWFASRQDAERWMDTGELPR